MFNHIAAFGGVGHRNVVGRRILMSGAAAFALCTPFAAQAQTTADASVEDDVASGNAIIVTATKREATLQEVPVAVTVATAETLQRDQIRDLKDLQTIVPSLQVGQRQSVANTNFFIRGFGNGANNAGIEPSVGVFVDNVYRSRTVAQVTDLPNVSRIEVLRGPQSTLFGKNASAGVISISSEEPQFDLGGSAELTYGNFETVVAKGYLTGPITDMVAVSVAAGINKRDGFFQDLGGGTESNNRDRWFLRGQVLLDNGSDFKLRLIGDVDQIDENCCGVSNVQSSLSTAAIIGIGGLVGDPSDPFSGNVFNNSDSINDIKNWGFSAQADYDLSDSFTLTSITAYRETDAITEQDSDFSSADLIFPNSQDLNVGTFTQEFRLAGEIANGVDLLLGAFYISEAVDQKNVLTYGNDVTSYANLLVCNDSGNALSLGGACFDPSVGLVSALSLEGTFGLFDGVDYTDQFMRGGQGFDEKYTIESEAISLFGQLDFEVTDGLVLTVGGNYTKDSKEFTAALNTSDVFSSIDLDAPQYAAFRNQLLFQGGVAQTIGDALGLGRHANAAEVLGFATGAATAASFPAIQAGAQAYANANMNNPLANPLAGLRVLQFLPPFLDIPNAVEDGKVSDDNFSYTVRLAYDVTPDVNIYASYATGFKASSINLSRDSRPFLADRDAIVSGGLSVNNLTYGSRFADPEKSRVIEFGLKAQYDNISLNLAVFDQEITGFQSNIFTGTGFALLNAGKQSTFGLEVEGQANFGGLQLTFGATYLDPVYDDFTASSVGNLSGTRPADIPEFTALIGAQYEIDLGGGVLVPRVNYLWQSEEQLIEGLPGFLVRAPDGSILDAAPALAAAEPFTRGVNDVTASLSYECDCGFTLSLWGRNLLNKRDLGVIFDSPAQPGAISGYPSDPRTYGASLRYSF